MSDNHTSKLAELMGEVLSPYIDLLVKSLLTAELNFEDATVESLSEVICFQIELTVRQAVKELNAKMRSGELEALRQLIRENPEAAKKASRFVAKKLKWRIRKIIEEELEQTKAQRERGLLSASQNHNFKKHCKAR